jgi:leucyl-tRNA synthetase
MAVPAHDERDFDVREKFGLPIRRVVARPATRTRRSRRLRRPRDGERLVNSGEFSGWPRTRAAGDRRPRWRARARQAAVTYRLRDWLISRQRYWGTPIPVIYCPTHGIVPVPDEDLPVRCRTRSTTRQRREPADHDEAFLNVDVPDRAASRPGARRTRWTRSSTRPGTGIATCRRTSRTARSTRSRRDVDPVEQYTGGAEHAVMHLLYAREFTKMVRDLGLVRQNEPWKRVFNQGQILGADGERMSKSRGNVQDPDELVSKYGADTVRLFLMFMGPWDQGGPWSPTGMGGVPPVPEPASGRSAWTRTTRSPATRTRARCPMARTRRRRESRFGPPPPDLRDAPPTTRRSTSTRWSRSSWS